MQKEDRLSGINQVLILPCATGVCKFLSCLQPGLMKMVKFAISRFQNFTATRTWKYRWEDVLKRCWSLRFGCWRNNPTVGLCRLTLCFWSKTNFTYRRPIQILSLEPNFLLSKRNSQFLQCTTGWAKKESHNILRITSSNTGRFSKFFRYHHHNLQEICNAAVIKYPTTLQTRCSAW